MACSNDGDLQAGARAAHLLRDRRLRRRVPQRAVRAADPEAPGSRGIAIYEANFRVSKIGEYFIYAVFVFGFAARAHERRVWKFSQTWVWLAIVLYIVGLGLSHGVLLPAVKRMGVLMREMVAPGRRRRRGAGGPPPQVAEMQALGPEGRRGRRDPRRHADRDPRPHGVEARASDAPRPNGDRVRTARRTMTRVTTTRSCAS